MKLNAKQSIDHFRKIVSIFVIAAFFANTVLPAYAQSTIALPAPGTQINLSPAFNPLILKAVKVNLNNPFQFDFIVDQGDTKFSDEQMKNESQKLIRYFLASLTTPENDLWVNLSPYEKNRIIPESFGVTEMGRDLLAQDYLLKQITATLMYPEGELGKKFWNKVQKQALEKFGTKDIPTSTFNKVWIVPQKAVVYENGATAYVDETKLKVMLEEDYVALSNNTSAQSLGGDKLPKNEKSDVNALGSQIVREIILPELEKEINQGTHFALLRQVYNSLVLANWYKKRMKDSILSKIYSDKNKVTGVDINDKAEAQKIYDQYVEAFKKGVYNYIKEDYDSVAQESIPRKYFSGGESLIDVNKVTEFRRGLPAKVTKGSSGILVAAKFDFSVDKKQVSAIKAPGLASSSLTEPVYNPAVLKNIQARYPNVAWDETIIDGQMFRDKPQTFGQHRIGELLIRNELPSVNKYRDLLSVIQNIRVVARLGGELTDKQISYLKAAEAHFRLLLLGQEIFPQISAHLTADEKKSRRFPSTNLQQVFEVYQVSNLNEFLDVLEQSVLRSLIDLLADQIPQGWRKLENLKRLYGGETVVMELARYRSRILQLLWGPRDQDPDYFAVINIPGATEELGQRASMVSKQSLRDLSLHENVLILGQRLNLLAHSVDEDTGGGLRNFLKIFLEGRIISRDGGMVSVGALSSENTPYSQGVGPFYAVFSNQYDFIVDNEISARPPNLDTDFKYFLFPSPEERDFARQVLDQAITQKVSINNRVITPELGAQIKAKLLTYQDFITEYQVILDRPWERKPGKSSSSIVDPALAKIVNGLSQEITQATTLADVDRIAFVQSKEEVLAIGDKMGFMSYGVSDSDWADPFRTFINIISEGQVNPSEGGFYFTVMSDKYTTSRRGDYFAVLNDKKYSNKGRTSAARPQSDEDFMYFVFPNASEKTIAQNILTKAVEQKVMINERADAIRAKLMTYEEFITRYKSAVEEVKAAEIRVKTTPFSDEFINEAAFGFNEQERAFARQASGEIAVSLAKAYFKTSPDKNVLIALQPFFDNFRGTYSKDQVGELLDSVLEKIMEGLSKQGVAQKYQGQIAQIFADYYYKNFHVPSKDGIAIHPDADLESEFFLGSKRYYNKRSLAIFEAGLSGFVAITKYPDQPVLLTDKNPFMVAALNEYKNLTGHKNVQILGEQMLQPNFGGQVQAKFVKILLPKLYVQDRSSEERRAILQNAAAILSPGDTLHIEEVLNLDRASFELARKEIEDVLTLAGLKVKALTMEVGANQWLINLNAATTDNSDAAVNSQVDDQEFNLPTTVGSSPVKAKSGGIDLTADQSKLDIRGNGAPIQFNFDPQQLQNLKIDGLVPVIINITPAVNLPLFLTENTNLAPQNTLSKIN